MSHRTDPPPGRLRRALPWSVAVALVVVPAVLASVPGLPFPAVPGLLSALGSVVLLLASARQHLRRPVTGVLRAAHRRLACGALVATAGAALDLVLWVARLLPVPWTGAPGTGALLATVPTTVVLVIAVLGGQRRREAEFFNGAAVLFLGTGGLFLLDHVLDLPGGHGWRRHMLFLAIVGLVMTVGARMVVTTLARRWREGGVWLGIVAWVPLFAATVVTGWTGADSALPTALWAAGSVVVYRATLAYRGPVEVTQLPALAPTVPVTIAFGVLLTAVTLLVVQAFGVGADATATCYLSVAVLLVSFRAGGLIRSLRHLAETTEQALTDDLTGVGNRRSLLQSLARLAEDGTEGTALFVIDLDRFKGVNDRYGHHVGDRALRAVTEALLADLPSGGLLARVGGDEFTVLLTGSDLDPMAVAHRLYVDVRASLKDDPCLAEMDLSIGVAVAAHAPVRGEDLLRQADAAMYVAKGEGGGVSAYDEVLDGVARYRAALLADLTELFAAPERLEAEMVLHYQPQVDVLTGRVVGVEALVRWLHSDRGLIPPGEFLSVAEEHGLMADLTFHVLRRATSEASGWSDAGQPLRVSVNLSASTLAHPHLMTFVEAALAVSRLEPGRLVLEVTETTLMSDPGTALALTRDLTDRGVQLSIDDYGTGYSSLAYLTDLPASELKLDQAFTRRLAAEPRTAAIVAATASLAHRLGLRVIAEGVEDEETLALLDELGADQSQGYLHARPLPVAQFQAWLTAHQNQGARADAHVAV